MSDTRAYEAAVVSELLRSEGWRVLKARLEGRLAKVRTAILKGRWDTPEKLRELAYLQGEEAFLDALTGDNVAKVIEALAEPDAEPQPEAHRVAPGRKQLGRARPPGE